MKKIGPMASAILTRNDFGILFHSSPNVTDSTAERFEGKGCVVPDMVKGAEMVAYGLTLMRAADTKGDRGADLLLGIIDSVTALWGDSHE